MCSFISFENLPLIEFKVDPKIAHRKVLELLYSDKSKNRKKARKDKDDGWSETNIDNANMLNFAQSSMGEDFENSPFFEKLNEIFEMQ